MPCFSDTKMKIFQFPLYSSFPLIILEVWFIKFTTQKGAHTMLSQELLQKFEDDITVFEEKLHAFEAGEIDRKTFKGISGGFGSYAQKESGYMLRLRLPGGHITKDTLKFLADKISEHQISLLKLTTCQTIQFHNLSADSVPQLVRDALKTGIVTLGGGGDNPRNVMASPLTGVAPDETFDVFPYAKAAGEYLLTEMPGLHMPRKLKVGFSNTPANEVHATFRDLGFVARENGTFSVYCAGGLGPNPKLGVHITDDARPEEVSLYVHAMIRLFTAYGNYESRAKSRTRYLQDTLGEEGIRSNFLQFVEEARNTRTPWPIESIAPISKASDGVLSEELLTEKRILPQKQDGLYTVSYHPLGGRLAPEKPAEIYEVIKEMPETELRISPDGTLYLINLTAKEVPAVLDVTSDGAASLFESSVSCIGVPICQHGLRNSYALLDACIRRIREEHFADGVLPRIHVSGCPSSCGSHQAAGIGFVGHSKRVDGSMESAFKLFVNGCGEEPGAHLGTEKGVILESVIPEFLAALGTQIAATDSTFDAWYPTHTEAFDALAAEYAEKTAV